MPDTNQESNINSFNAFYYGLRTLEDEQQKLLISNYKMTELYHLCINEKDYMRFLESLANTAKLSSNMLKAVRRLHDVTKAGIVPRTDEENIEFMVQSYDELSHEGKEKFCAEIANNRQFFSDLLRLIIGNYRKALNDLKDRLKDK